MKSILDRGFVYRNSTNTNIRLLFARVRKELAAKAEAEAKKPVATIRQIKVK